ncbi:hypothetical protein B0H13DRAFT_2140551 [Mycena leptocephala]|nr:hypothetical protein B0H13DRAFT_2140551 [Mycena leptocephala]
MYLRTDLPGPVVLTSMAKRKAKSELSTEERSTREKKAEWRRNYYAQHPELREEIREKQRILMAEKRAAVKANRRRWDPPKKTDPAVVQDSEVSTAAESESAVHQEPELPLRRATSSKPKKMPSVQQETRNGVALRPRSTADAASGADDSSGEEFYDESRDADYLPGERTVKERRAASRKASARHYKEHKAEIREKRRIYMAERRAAIKARRRRWDPPKKPKLVVLQEETSVAALPDEEPVSQASSVQRAESTVCEKDHERENEREKEDDGPARQEEEEESDRESEGKGTMDGSKMQSIEPMLEDDFELGEDLQLLYLEPSPNYTFHSSASQSPSRSRSPASSSSYSASPTVPLLMGARFPSETTSSPPPAATPSMPPSTVASSTNAYQLASPSTSHQLASASTSYQLTAQSSASSYQLSPLAELAAEPGLFTRLTQSWGELQAEVVALRAEMRAVAELEVRVRRLEEGAISSPVRNASSSRPTFQSNAAHPLQHLIASDLDEDGDVQMDVDAPSPPAVIVDGARTTRTDYVVSGNQEPPRSRKFSSTARLASA